MAKFWEIEKHLGTFEQAGSYTKEANLVSYNNKPAVLDLRAWTENDSGEKICCKGFTLSTEGARKLITILQLYLDTQDEREGKKPPVLHMIRKTPAADPETDIDTWREQMSKEFEEDYADRLD